MTEEQAATAVARAMFPSADWQSENLAWVECPGIGHHTTSNGRRDCRLTLNDGMPPTIFCCHNSCADVIAEQNRQMRSSIGRLKTVQTGNHLRAGRVAAEAPRTTAPKVAAAPTEKKPLAPLALPDPIPDGERIHLETCFRPDETVGIVFGSGPEGKPLNRGHHQAPAAVPEDRGNGTFIRVNPMRSGGFGDADVATWRHCLLECDNATFELQWAAIVESGLPVSVAVYSGGRSIHAWVRIDASTAEEFRERAKLAADALDEFQGIKVDRSVLNPSRLSRLAGRKRGERIQALLAVNVGAACWDDWLSVKKSREMPQEEPKKEPKRSRPVPQFYYRKRQKDFIMVRDEVSDVVPLDKEGVKLAFEFEGVASSDDKAGMRDAIYRTMTENGIDYDGSLPGYCRGMHYQGGKRYFVDSQAQWLTAVPSSGIGVGWPQIAMFLQGLLCPDNKPENIAPFMHLCWSLKLSREGLRQALAMPSQGHERNTRPGPASVFCGAKNCGKSFLVNHIITPLLGGRAADAHKAFTSGADGFNGELLQAEVWTVDDKVHACDIKSRRQFAASIKSFLYSGLTGFHAKFKEQISIVPWARLFILCNDQDEAIRVLPVLTDDIADKIHLWRCYNRPEGLPTTTADEWAKYGATIKAELPAFAGWLDALEIPEKKRHSRNGMTCWQDPYIVGLLADQTPEHQLGQLLAHLFENGLVRSIYNATAQEILEKLNDIESIRWQLKNLVHDDPSVLGRYLGRLMSDTQRLQKMGLRIEVAGQRRNGRGYTLTTPQEETPE